MAAPGLEAAIHTAAGSPVNQPNGRRSASPFAAVHVLEEQVLPACRAVLHPPDAVHELGGAQHAMWRHGEDDARVLEDREDLLDSLGGVSEALVHGGGRPL